MKVTMETLQAQLAALAAENAALKARPAARLSLKVSAKGAVSVYGLGRWPVTLYASQMRRFLAIGPEIEKFMAQHAPQLTEKGDGDADPPSPSQSLIRR